MRILVSGATPTVNEMLCGPYSYMLGKFLTPNNGNDLDLLIRSTPWWAIDNGAYSKFVYDKFWNLLIETWIRQQAGMPLFVAVEDVVADGKRTLDLFMDWKIHLEDEIGFIPWNLALVLQNGMEDMDLPWDEFPAVFVGGTTDWKLYGAISLAKEAKRRGKYVHVGRVNTHRRLRWARDVLGADSVDGTNFTRFPRVKLTRALEVLHQDELHKAEHGQYPPLRQPN